MIIRILPMKAHLYWNGVRMRTLQINTDYDGNALRSVTLPILWGDDVARALTEIAPSTLGPIKLSSEAARWIELIEATPPHPYIKTESSPNHASIGRSLSGLLLMQHMAPNLALWQYQNNQDHTHHNEELGFVLRLSAFVQEGIFAFEQFVACLELACESLRRLYYAFQHNQNNELPLFDKEASEKCTYHNNPSLNNSKILQKAGIISFTDLDACLAALGLDYESDDARDFASALTALSRTILYAGTARPVSPLAYHDFPEFEEIAISSITKYAPHIDLPIIELGYSNPSPIDALLGVEACGLGPIFSLLDNEGHLRSSTLHRLAHRNLTTEKALALALGGIHPLPQPTNDAHIYMYDILAPFLDKRPIKPENNVDNTFSHLERGIKRPLPTRQKGFTQQASIGGHRLFMRTSEFSDGTLAALTLTPVKESPMVRGLMESLAHSVSIGLQYGVPLKAYIEQFAYTNFGPCGVVEGDPDTLYASSMLDYAFRTLSETYLNHHLPDAPSLQNEETLETPMLPFHHNTSLKEVETHRKVKRKLRLVG